MTVVYNLHNCQGWASITSYSVGQTVSNDTGPIKAYRCITAGTSAATGGPTGTGSSITDGTAVWKYLSSVDFTTIAAANAGIGTLTDATELWLWNDAEWWSGVRMTISGHSTTPTNTLTIRAAPGESFRDKSNNPLRYDPSFGVAIKNLDNYIPTLMADEQYVTFFGLQFQGSGAPGSPCVGEGQTVGNNMVVDSCVLDQGNNAGPITNILGRTTTFRNCVMIVSSNSQAVPSFFSTYMYNCTLVRVASVAPSGTALTHNYDALTLVNCAVFGFTTLEAGRDPRSYTNCVTDLASPPAGFTTVSYSGQFQDNGATVANRDFRLANGSALIDAGTADSTDIPSAVDIFGTARPQGSAWDIGAFEVQPPPGNAIGSASGSTTVAGIGAQNAATVGTINGSTTVSANAAGLASGAANSVGSATVTGTARATAQTLANGSGSGLATGVGQAQGIAGGTASGTVSMAGTAQAIVSSVGQAAGSVAIVGSAAPTQIALTTGSANGQAAVNGATRALRVISSTASATGQTAVQGASAALIARAASATGHAVVSGIGTKQVRSLVVGTQGPVTVYSVPIVIQVAYPGYGTSVV